MSRAITAFYIFYPRTGRIQTVRCVPDIISLNAFKNNGVTELWGQGFTHWMPICELDKSYNDGIMRFLMHALMSTNYEFKICIHYLTTVIVF